MTAIDLKKLLIHKIAEIDDVSFLNAIKIMLDTKTDNAVYNLTNEQRKDIVESRLEIEKGLFIEQTELDKEFEKWLSLR